MKDFTEDRILSKTTTPPVWNVLHIACGHPWFPNRGYGTFPCSPVILAPLDLVAHWKMDEGTGLTAYDSSFFHNDGTRQNGPSWVTGMVGDALSFDGVDDYVNVQDSPSLQMTSAVTVSAWVKFNAVDNTYDGLVFKQGPEPGGVGKFIIYGLRRYRTDGSEPAWMGKIGFDTVNEAGTWVNVKSTFVPVTGTWYHVVGVYDGATLKLYINGSLDNSATQTGDLVSSIGQPLYLGRADLPEQKLRGLLDEVRVYKRALTAVEVQVLFNWPYS